MAITQGPRSEWVDLRGIRHLAERAAAGARSPAVDQWGDAARPLLERHWVLADHDWHRRRTWQDAAGDHDETHHAFTRYALLPDARLVRADRRCTEVRAEDGALRAGPWEQEVRNLTDRDIRTLDRRAAPFSTDRGTTTTWGTQPAGDPFLPWAGAGVETLLRALSR
jgi:hypothetical protein